MVWTGGSQGKLAPCLVALFEQADARWPHRSKISDGTLGDPAHAARVSDHNPKPPNPPGWVDAADITEDDTRGPNLRRFWQHLISRRDPRVKYVIYEGEIVKSYATAGRPAWVPQPYTGPNPHASHLHISVLPEGRFDLSPWFPPPSDQQPPEPPAQEDDMLQVIVDGNVWLIGLTAHPINLGGIPSVHDQLVAQGVKVITGPHAATFLERAKAAA